MLPPDLMVSPEWLHHATRVVLQTTCLGVAGLILPLSLLDLPIFGVPESESLMNFSSHGTLYCICKARHTLESADDRRQSCRTCGNAIPVLQAHRLHERMTQAEVVGMRRLLRHAGARAKNIEIPPTITNVHQLMAYLDSKEARKGRKPPRRPNSPVGAERLRRLSSN